MYATSSTSPTAPGHDQRYAIDCSKLKRDLGTPAHPDRPIRESRSEPVVEGAERTVVLR